MAKIETANLIRDAKALYDRTLRSELEPAHNDEFVAIEPVSGEYFLGSTLSEAINAARDAYPTRLSHTMRVGHDTAVHFGVHLA